MIKPKGQTTMSEFQIILPDGDPSLEPVIKAPSLGRRWEALGGLRTLTGGPLANAEEYIEAIGDAKAVLVGWPLPSGVFSACPHLEFASFLGTGAANYIDLEEAAQCGVTVSNTPGYGDVAVAEHTIALMLSSLRNIPQLDQKLKDGDWVIGVGGTELRGKVVGLVGLGGIGAHVAQLLKAFGATVKVWTRNPSAERAEKHGVEFVELSEMFQTSDIVSLHLSLTRETEQIVDSSLLAQLREGALFVNTARAELVDEETLRELLREGRIRAAIDVFTPEPLLSNHAYRGLSGTVLTPHVGFDTPEALVRMMEITASNCEAYFANAAQNVVTL